jgi:FKBP-type peptidyl-prolyl cis-trans isomerase FkpA
MTKVFNSGLVFLFTTTILFSCNQFKVTTDTDGSKYQIHSSKESKKKPQTGDMITFDLVLKAGADSSKAFKDTYKEGTPITMPLQKGNFKGSFENALYHIAEGDSATVFVNADSLFARVQQPLPPGVKAGSDMKFIVKMEKIQTQADFGKEQDKKRDGEGKTMAEFAAKNMPNAQKTETGILFTTQKAGTGDSPAKGDTVVVNYTGKLVSGKIFDSSVGKQPITFPIGVGYVIPGWDQALLKMKKGEKGTYFIPSALAYGPQGIPGTIPAYSSLMFDIELVDVKHAKK